MSQKVDSAKLAHIVWKQVCILQSSNKLGYVINSIIPIPTIGK